MSHQRWFAKNGKLEASRHARLAEMGFVFDSTEARRIRTLVETTTKDEQHPRTVDCVDTPCTLVAQNGFVVSALQQEQQDWCPRQQHAAAAAASSVPNHDSATAGAGMQADASPGRVSVHMQRSGCPVMGALPTAEYESEFSVVKKQPSEVEETKEGRPDKMSGCSARNAATAEAANTQGCLSSGQLNQSPEHATDRPLPLSSTTGNSEWTRRSTRPYRTNEDMAHDDTVPYHRTPRKILAGAFRGMSNVQYEELVPHDEHDTQAGGEGTGMTAAKIGEAARGSGRSQGEAGDGALHTQLHRTSESARCSQLRVPATQQQEVSGVQTQQPVGMPHESPDARKSVHIMETVAGNDCALLPPCEASNRGLDDHVEMRDTATPAGADESLPAQNDDGHVPVGSSSRQSAARIQTAQKRKKGLDCPFAKPTKQRKIAHNHSELSRCTAQGGHDLAGGEPGARPVRWPYKICDCGAIRHFNSRCAACGVTAQSLTSNRPIHPRPTPVQLRHHHQPVNNRSTADALSCSIKGSPSLGPSSSPLTPATSYKASESSSLLVDTPNNLARGLSSPYCLASAASTFDTTNTAVAGASVHVLPNVIGVETVRPTAVDAAANIVVEDAPTCVNDEANSSNEGHQICGREGGRHEKTACEGGEAEEVGVNIQMHFGSLAMLMGARKSKQLQREEERLQLLQVQCFLGNKAAFRPP